MPPTANNKPNFHQLFMSFAEWTSPNNRQPVCHGQCLASRVMPALAYADVRDLPSGLLSCWRAFTGERIRVADRHPLGLSICLPPSVPRQTQTTIISTRQTLSLSQRLPRTSSPFPQHDLSGYHSASA